MENTSTAQQVLDACGGADNIMDMDVCMTRLRVTLKNGVMLDTAALQNVHKVLGIRRTRDDYVEIVFGPAIIDNVANEFSELTGRDIPNLNEKTAVYTRAIAPASTLRTPTPARAHSYAAQRQARIPAMSEDELAQLRDMLGDAETEEKPVPKRSLLVLNGPNLNMLGIREPEIYGRQTYADLVTLCENAGKAAGFGRVVCRQSNHEGSLVDEIQAAYQKFDGIVFNPAAYTHTSVALLDALKTVGIPCVEVHISEVSEREDFRQVSYVRQACIATVMGEGFQGYVHAIQILADHLGM
jgi:3-dehydroquinate dehydratase-2